LEILHLLRSAGHFSETLHQLRQQP